MLEGLRAVKPSTSMCSGQARIERLQLDCRERSRTEKVSPATQSKLPDIRKWAARAADYAVKQFKAGKIA